MHPSSHNRATDGSHLNALKKTKILTTLNLEHVVVVSGRKQSWRPKIAFLHMGYVLLMGKHLENNIKSYYWETF